MAIKMKYKGNGFMHGIPNRDLTDFEVEIFGIDRLRASGLYEEVKKSKPKKAKPVTTYDDEVELLENEIEKIEDTFEED